MEGPSFSLVCRNYFRTLVQGALASAQGVTEDDETQTSLPWPAMDDDRISNRSTAVETDEKSGCSLTSEEKETKGEEEDEEGEKDEDKELIALRRGMARLKTSLGHVQGEREPRMRHHEIAVFTILERGLEVLEQAKNTKDV